MRTRLRPLFRHRRCLQQQHYCTGTGGPFSTLAQAYHLSISRAIHAHIGFSGMHCISHRSPLCAVTSRHTIFDCCSVMKHEGLCHRRRQSTSVVSAGRYSLYWNLELDATIYGNNEFVRCFVVCSCPIEDSTCLYCTYRTPQLPGP